jgi:hypothetical protein
MGAMKKLEMALGSKAKKVGKNAKKAEVSQISGQEGKKKLALPEDKHKKDATKQGVGRTTLANMSETQKKEEIEELLADLAKSTDVEEKKRIRRNLRARGHYGGLSSNGKRTGKAEKEAPAKK